MNKQNAIQIPVESIDSSCSDDNSMRNNKKTKEKETGNSVSETEDDSSIRKNIEQHSNSKTIVSSKQVPIRKTTANIRELKKDKSVQTTKNTEVPKPINLYPEITKNDVITVFASLSQTVKAIVFFSETYFVWFVLYF